MNAYYLRTALRLMLVALWVPTLALAGSITLQTTFEGITLTVVSIVAALSTLSGATALVVRIDKELRSQPDATLPRPWLFVSANMLGSWLAATVAFITGEGQDMNDWTELGFIIVASFIGARFLEMIAEKYLAKLKDAP